MRWSQEALRRIIEQSSPLHERVHGHFVADATRCDDEVITKRLAKWRQVAAAGDQQKFDQRLRWAGWDMATVRAALVAVRRSNDGLVPAWAQTLNAIVTQAAAVDPEHVYTSTCRNPEQPMPFEEIFLPFVEVARQRLMAHAQEHLWLLSPQAHTRLEGALLQRLARLCFRTLALEFSLFRMTRQHTAFAFFLGQLQGASSRHLYKDFVTGMFAGRLVSLFTDYPVLARLTAQMVDFWVAASSEFLRHLAEDLSRIQAQFAIPELGRVEELWPSLSDPHNQGRSVIGVQFACGLKVMYKPKDLGAEAHFFGTLAWLNQQQAFLPFRVLQVLNRGSHGWVEFVEAFPCQDAAEISRYYQRCGLLLGLVYALRGTDFHFENMLACGEQPVLVDLETLLTPRLPIPTPSDGPANAHRLACMQVGESVLNTGLLPVWMQGPGRDLFDMSGLGAVDEQEIKATTLRDINTDNMGLSEGTATIAGGRNSPFAPHASETFRDYMEDIVRGFQAMYRFLRARLQTLIAPSGPFTSLATQRYRLIYRNTMLYATLLAKSCHPQLLRDGVDRSIALDALCRALLHGDEAPPLWPVVAAERQALEQGDIPLLTFRGDGTVLEAEGMASMPRAFLTSGYDAMRTRLMSMNDEDLERQVELVRGALYTRVLTSPTTVGRNVCDRHGPSLQRQQLLREASSIGQELARRAIRAADGSACWLGMHYDALTNRYHFQPMHSGLYSGTAGVAVFLAALARLTATPALQELALGACTMWQHLMAEATPEVPSRLTNTVGIGAGNGIASTVYALATVSQLLEAPALLETARQTAEWLTVERLQADTHFDILHGAAGVILVLLKLYRLTGEAAFLDRAILAGQHIVTHRSVDANAMCTWKTSYPTMLTGFSQGAAGVAYALLQLFAMTGDHTYHDVAKAAIAYEQTAFAVEANNWYDFRPFTMTDGTPTCATSWCHGAPGIGLARLATLAMLDTDAIQRDIDVALRTTRRAGVHGVDHLCCGSAGRIDVLLTAAQKLSRPDCCEAAQGQAAWMVERAQQDNTFHLYPNVPSNVYNPALFQGTAGIGYTLLRLAAPEALPCLLLWE